ncbi:PREDICTED: uncharacterized protein LOC104822094 [Tarenaya hassleriana]|uniref:uncharacterized protein LOC104822094 n=1 Tax=Tarenaya hassleriana TaxID=28532 RepID=UPI00053C381F|nr:PREDICTED: uncharacterized protein LOC104822094 [Tarenaya hassleriana]
MEFRPSLPRVHPSVRIPISSSSRLSVTSERDTIHAAQKPHSKRWSPSKADLLILEEAFSANVGKIKTDTKNELSEKLKIPPRAVALWFTKRRAEHKSEKLEEKSVVSRARYLNCMAYLDRLSKRNETLMQIPVAATNGTLITLDEDTTKANGSKLLQLVDPRNLYCVGRTGETASESYEEANSSANWGSADEYDCFRGLGNIVEEGDSYTTNSYPFPELEF